MAQATSGFEMCFAIGPPSTQTRLESIFCNKGIHIEFIFNYFLYFLFRSAPWDDAQGTAQERKTALE